MCGIAGLISENVWDHDFRHHLINRWRALLNHRGPDGYGWYGCNKLPMLLYHSRLKVTGVNNGFQPVPNELNTIWLVFNGELYGHKKLRKELESTGHSFRSDSDAEVLIHLYEQSGISAIIKLRGEFSFALYDSNIRKLFLVRDRFGIKPLYYAHLPGGKFYFASEIKAIFGDNDFSRKFNQNTLRNYTNTFFFESETPFEKVMQVPPAHYICYDLEKDLLQKCCYWQLPLGISQKGRTDNDYEEEFHYLLQESVQIRIPEEVKYGAYLSGGLDSSAITSMLHVSDQVTFPVFSIGFKDSHYDESLLASQLAKKLELPHHILMLGKGSLKEAFIESIWNSEIPVLNTHGAAKSLLAKEAKQHCKVVLTGEGADELLLGYDLFRHLDTVKKNGINNNFKKISVSGAALSGKLKHQREVINTFGAYPYTMHRFFYLKKIVWWLLSSSMKKDQWDWKIEIPKHISLNLMKGLNSIELTQQFLLHTDFPSYILNYLGDRQEMAAGLEGRLPFLDHIFAEFICALPEHLKLQKGTGKYILRKTMKGSLPEDIINRSKNVFYAPAFESIGLFTDADYFRAFTNKATFAEVGIFNPVIFKTLIRLSSLIPARHPLLPVVETVVIYVLSLHILYDLYIRNFDEWSHQFAPSMSHEPQELHDANKIYKL
jgi:asparagine synthase (glutamine-hydrolysing)